jgi:hypothetical protein
MQPRKRLSDIVKGKSWLDSDWNSVQAAPDYGKPIPKGKYPSRLLSADLFQSRNNKPGIKLAFEICEGPHQGRRLWYDIWLTEAAAPGARRDLAKLGVSSKAQLDAGIPPGVFLCELTVVVNVGDDKTERNTVKTFEVTGVEPSDAYAPETGPDSGEPDSSFNVEEFDGASPKATSVPASDAPGSAPSTDVAAGRKRKPKQDSLPFQSDLSPGPYAEGR